MNDTNEKPNEKEQDCDSELVPASNEATPGAENMQTKTDEPSKHRNQSLLRKAKMFGLFSCIFLTGYITAVLISPDSSHLSAKTADTDSQAKTQWTCSMHPQFKLPEKGKCPICFMDLIPMEKGTESSGAVLEMSPNAMKLAEIQTSFVERRIAEAELSFVGKVDYDETRMKTITSWMPGRLDRLYVDYTGVPVKKGDHLVSLFSPDLISAQEELLQAIRAVKELSGSSNDFIKSTARSTVQATREKLRLLGVTSAQIARLEKTRKVEDHLTIYAPTGGIVVHKNAMEGMYVKTGSPIYRIADLSFVWVYLEAYETDLAWLRYGQTVEFETEAYPGEPFAGRISFIDPILNTRTRTVKIRVNTPNSDGRLKPGMFVRARVTAKMAKGGRILDNALAGKWISPMHPEVVKDKPGDCDVCGMPLVRAESLGLAHSKKKTELPLLVPRSSVMLTGSRAVVYIKKAGKTASFEGRLVTLGPRVGQYYIVKSGVKEGDEIVTHGAFKIDSALQIQAKPSMMSPDSGAEDHSNHEHEAKDASIEIAEEMKADLRRAFATILTNYLAIQESLAADKPTKVTQQSSLFLVASKDSKALLLDDEDWIRLTDDLIASAVKLSKSQTIKEQRADFSAITQTLLVVLSAVGSPRTLDEVSCPMAFGGLGGTWLQAPGEIANPYFGASMLRCGEVKNTIKGAK
ncbi:MAG: efflux RND transporter periplasmic adaptor subunit [Planctomycetota bacterium]|nr:efflux RND transporter periplasmic adaptor subunit [Planctomycetota bacterium]